MTAVKFCKTLHYCNQRPRRRGFIYIKNKKAMTYLKGLPPKHRAAQHSNFEKKPLKT